MDILYVIGRGSKWGNNELLYSLRSIEKNCSNAGRIFIAGYYPSFIDKSKVTYIPVEDKYDCKHKNIMQCIEAAVEKSDISDDFLYSSDDHFYVQHTDFDNYPFYRKPIEMPNTYDEQNAYHRTLTSTRLLLEQYGLPIYNFSWHGNTHFNKTLFSSPEFVEIRKKSYEMRQGVEPTILMLNYWYAKKPFEITDRRDVKLRADANMTEIVMAARDRECISCASNVSLSAIRQYLIENFPKKSKYEL